MEQTRLEDGPAERRGWRAWLPRLRRRKPLSKGQRRLRWLLLAPVIAIGSLSFLPEALLWPHSARFGETRVYSEAPIPAEMARIIARSDSLLAASPLYEGPVARRVFLSEGGWRWKLLALRTSGAFAFRRPFRNSIMFNRTDIAADRVENGRTLGGDRTLSGTLAHETTHMLIARRYGEIQAGRFPDWKTEGYCDHVAQESSLSPEEYRIVEASGNGHPALDYYRGRMRVARFLARGKSVDALFLGEGD